MSRVRRLPELLRRNLSVIAGPPSPKFDPKLDYALTGFSPTGYYQTELGGGDGGQNNVWGFALLFYLRALPTAYERLFGRCNDTNKGWRVGISASGTLLGSVVAGNGTMMNTPIWQFKGSDLGKIHGFLLSNTAGAIYGHTDRTAHGSTALASYTGHNGPTIIGASEAGLNPARGADVLVTLTFNGNPTPEQVTAIFDAARRGEPLSTLPGATLRDRWSLKDTLSEAGVPVTGGQAAPAVLPELTAYASQDLMTLSGSASVRVLDPQQREGRKTLGISGFGALTSKAFLTTDPGFVGASSGFHIHFLVFIGTLTTTRTIFISGSQFHLRLTSTGPQMAFMFPAFPSNSTYNLTASQRGRWLFCTAVYDPAVGPRLFVEGAEVGAGGTPVAYSPAAAAFSVGNNPAADAPATDVSIGFVSCSNTLPTPAAVKAAFEAWRDERVVPVPPDAATGHLYDFTKDLEEAGGPSAGVPMVLRDRVGSQHFDQGVLKVVPTSHGLRALGPTGYGNGFVSRYDKGIRCTPSGFHVVADLWFSVTPPLTAYHVFTSAPDNKSGYVLGGGVGTLYGRTYHAAGSVLSSAYTLTAGDLGKRVRVLFQHTGTAIRLYVNSDVQVGVDKAATPVANDMPMQVGTNANAPGCVIEAISGGSTVLTSGEIAALFADLTTTIPVTPGKTEKHYLLEQDIAAAAGKLPAELVERVSGGDSLRLVRALKVAQTVERQWAWEAP